jgi:hypothetical protein
MADYKEDTEKRNFSQRYITEIQLEKMTGRSRKSWQRDRIKGGGVKFIRCGGKILYDMRDIESWLEDHKFESTSGYTAVRS